MGEHKGGSKGITPTEEEQKMARDMIKQHGEAGAAEKIGITKVTLARLAAGCAVAKGSIAQLKLACKSA